MLEVSTTGKLTRIVAFSPSSKLPKWRRTLHRDDAGEVYAPAVCFGNEMGVFFRASQDGAGVVIHSQHFYVPLSWARREYPRERELIDACEQVAARAEAES
jgi:hypothetical protein